MIKNKIFLFFLIFTFRFIDGMNFSLPQPDNFDVLEVNEEIDEEEKYLNTPEVKFILQKMIIKDKIEIFNALFPSIKEPTVDPMKEPTVDPMNDLVISKIFRPLLRQYHSDKNPDLPLEQQWLNKQHFKILNSFSSTLPRKFNNINVSAHIQSLYNNTCNEIDSLQKNLDRESFENIMHTMEKSINDFTTAPIHLSYKDLLKKQGAQIIKDNVYAARSILNPDINNNILMQSIIGNSAFEIGINVSTTLLYLFEEERSSLKEVISYQLTELEKQPLSSKQKEKLEQLKRRFEHDNP